MSNRDLGTAILNIRVQFEKIDTKLIDAKIQQLNESISKALKSAKTATDLRDSGKQIGNDFVTGFTNGIKEKEKDVEEATSFLGKISSFFLKKATKSNSPSKVTYKIGQDFVAGFILGVKSKFDNVRGTIESIAGGSISGLNSQLDQLTVARQKLARATLLRDAEESKDPADQNRERLRNLERIQVNLVEEIKLLEARNQADKSYAIDKVSKRRADEIERTTKSIEKNAGASKKVAGTIVEFSRQYTKSDKTIKTFNNTVQASTRVVSEYFSKIVQGSKKTQDFQGAANELEAEYRRIRTQVKSSIADQKLQVRVLAELKRAYQEQRNVLISVAEAERRAAGTKQGTKDARDTVALGTTNATALMNQIAGLTNLAQAMRSLGQDATKVDQAILILQKRLKKVADAAISSVRNLQNQAGGLTRAYSKIQEINDKINLNDLTSRVSGVRAVGNIGATAFKEIINQAKATRNLRDANNQLDKALVTLIKRIRQTVRDTRLQGQMINAVRRSYRQATEDVNNFRRAIDLRAGIQGLRQYTSGINQFGEQLRRVSFILRDVGRQMMTLGKAGFRAVLPNLGDFAKYEQAVVDVLATTGDLNNGLTRTNVLTTSLSKRILDLAGTFMFSAEEIAKVAKQLALAGFSTEQIEDSLDSVLQLASATGSDLTTAANIAISAMSTFGIEAEDTSRIADVFAATVTRSNTNLNQLAEAFKVVAPVASQFGQSIEETSAALGILGNAGLKGTLAGTGLARILTQLVEKGDTLDSILRGMGSSFDALDPQKNNFSDILKEFERLNLSSSTLLEIFDLRAFRSLNALLAQGADGLGSLVDQLERADAVAEAISGARLQTLAASIQLLSDAATSLRISIGSLVANEAIAFLDFLREAVVGIRAFIEENRETIAPFMKFLLTSLATLTSAGAAIFGLGSAASFAAAPFIGFGAILAGVMSVLGGVGTVSIATGVAFSSLLAPVAAVTAAVTGLAALLSGLFVGVLTSVAVSISNFTDKWGEFFDKVVSVTSELINNILPRLASGFSNNLYKIELASDRLIKALGLVFDPEALNSFSWETLGETVATATAFFLEFAAVVVEDLTPSLQGLLDRIDLLIQIFDRIPTIAGLDNNVGLDAIAEGITFLRYLLTGSAGLYAVTKIYEGVSYLISLTLQWFGIFKSESQPAANEVDKLNKAFESQRDKIADLIDKAQDYSKALTKIQPMLNNLGDATPMDLKALRDAAEGGFLNTDSRKEFLGQLSSQLAELEKLKEGMGENSDKRFEVAGRIKQLEKLIQTIQTIGDQFDKIQDLVANKTVPQLTEDFKRIVSEEGNKIKALEGIQDKILKMQRNTGRLIKREDVKAIARQIFELTGENIEIDWSNPMQSLTAALRSTINNALTDSKANLEMVRRLTDILPDLGEIDLTNPDDLDKLVEAFSKVKDNSEEIAENLKSSLEAQLKIQKEIDDLNRTAYERKREELRLQAKERKEQLKQTRETLLLEQEMLQQNLRSAEIEGKSTEAIQSSIETNLANLEANRKLATRLGFGQGKPFSFEFYEDDARMEAMVDQNEELLKMDQEAREKAELELAETRLEVETDVQKRIALRTQLIEAKRAKELKDKIEALRSNVNLARDRAELDRLEKETEDAVNAAKSEELRKMRDEETKDQTKEQEKALDRNQEIVNKRVDLENELLSNLGKQVTTLQEMAMLMKFIEVLQRRKDQEALRSIRQLSKERQKLVRMEAAGDGSAKSQAAIKAQQDTVAFLAGVVGRNKGQAGAEGGDPRGIFNIEAFLRQLNLGLDKFVDGLKQNPIEIPIKLDTDKVIEDLKKAFKNFNVGGIAGTMVQGLNLKSNLVGANFGTINHNDNSVTNINVKNFDASLALKLGLTSG